MRTSLLSVIAMLIVTGNVAALKVNTDHDSSFDFSVAKTVAWTQGTAAPDELNQRRIVAAIEEQLRAKGLEIVEAGADLEIATHVATEDQTKSSGKRVGLSVSKRTSWGSVGVGGSGGNKVQQVTVGTLLIDIKDSASGNLVWRANASDTLDGNTSKTEAKIRKAVEKAFKQFPPK